MKRKFILLYTLIFAILGTTAYTVGQLTAEQPQEAEEYVYDELQQKQPSGEGAADLSFLNEDYAGWLWIPDTPISLPVVLGTDNSFYLSHSFSGTRSQYGCLFFDTQSTEDAHNRVIYGHNMGRGREEMFSPLVDYLNQGYAEMHKQIFFQDPSGAVYEYEVFAVVNFDTAHINQFDYRKPFFKSDVEYRGFVTYLLQNSLYQSTFEPEGKKMLILSTCNIALGDTNRLLVCASKLEN